MRGVLDEDVVGDDAADGKAAGALGVDAHGVGVADVDAGDVGSGAARDLDADLGVLDDAAEDAVSGARDVVAPKRVMHIVICKEV